MTTTDRLTELLDLAAEHFNAHTDQQLATHLGVRQSTVWRWRHGVRSPQAEAILTILNAVIDGPLPVAETAA